MTAVATCAVACPHAGATAAGVEVVRQGGNALDAALAAALALTVAYPHNTSLGGDLFALVRQPDGTTRSVNASGPAPCRLDVEAVGRRHGRRMPDRGIDTVTVPGAVAGLGAVHGLGAALPWAALVAPAHTMAADGVAVAPGVARAIAEERELVLGDAGLSALLAPGGRPLAAGSALVQPALAATLERLAVEGPGEFYRGAVAQRLLAGLAAAGSPLEPRDFEEFAPAVEAPLRGTVFGVDVATSPPNSQGFVLLAVLAAIEQAGLAGPFGEDAGVLASVFAEASSWRDRHLADPRAMAVGVDELLDPKAWGQWLGSLNGPGVPGGPGGPGLPLSGAGRPATPGGDTVAVVAADTEGRAVSLIQSLYQSFGAGILEPSTGVIVHDRGALFSLDPASPNMLAPGKRPAHTLMPVLVSEGGVLRVATGTMGGKAQPQIHAQLLLRVLAGDRPAEALARPRWVVEAGGGRPLAAIEPGVAPEARAAIAGRMDVTDLSELDETTGHAHLVVVDGPNLLAASDPRSDGAAAVVRCG